MDARRVAALVIAVVGLLALIAGLIYMTVPAGSLPSFFPGHLAGVQGKRTTRGGAGIALGVVLLIAGGALGYRRRSLYPH